MGIGPNVPYISLWSPMARSGVLYQYVTAFGPIFVELRTVSATLDSSSNRLGSLVVISCLHRTECLSFGCNIVFEWCESSVKRVLS